MKTKQLLFILCLMISSSSVCLAQSELDHLVAEWERAKVYTQEYLEAMPEAGYASRPTPEMRSFAEQLLHLTEANYGFAAMAAGIQSPVERGSIEKSEDKSKARVTKLVLDGYDFVIQTLKGMDQAKTGEEIELFGRFKMTRKTAFEKCFEHQTHHRGQTTVYLRLAGVTPPQEKLF